MSKATPRQEALRLAELWHRLAALHVAFGCSCSMSGVSVSLEDFERDIADWLWAESQRTKAAEVQSFLLAPGPIAQQVKPIRQVLERLAVGEAPASVADWLLPKLSRTIESYARLHGPVTEAPLMGGSKAWRRGYRS